MSNHRSFLYDLGWELMDLRQDIEFGDVTDQPYPITDTVTRLRSLQDSVAAYADQQLKRKEPGWEVESDF